MVHGLQVARENDVAIVPGVIDRGVQWLRRYQDGEVQKIKNAPTKTIPYKRRADNLDALVHMVLADAKIENVAMRDFLYRDRTHLAVYAKSLFEAARMHHQWLPDMTLLEEWGFSPDSRQQYESMGHALRQVRRLGSAQVIFINRETGRLEGVTDSRTMDGGAAGY